MEATNTEKKKEVFCKDCEYKIGPIFESRKWICCAPENIIKEIPDILEGGMFPIKFYRFATCLECRQDGNGCRMEGNWFKQKEIKEVYNSEKDTNFFSGVKDTVKTKKQISLDDLI